MHIGARRYGLFYAGEGIRTVAWREGDATYWVQNALTNGVQPREMLAIAQSAQPVMGAGGGESSVASISLPPRSTESSSVLSKIGAAASLLCLLPLAGLAILLLSRRRELAALRPQVRAALALEERQRPLTASAPPRAGETLSARPLLIALCDQKHARRVSQLTRVRRQAAQAGGRRRNGGSLGECRDRPGRSTDQHSVRSRVCAEGAERSHPLLGPRSEVAMAPPPL